PVLDGPVESKALHGIASLLSIMQMPAGVPVGTLAIGRAAAVNAALLATSILENKHPAFRTALLEYRRKKTQEVLDKPDPRPAGPVATGGPPVAAGNATGEPPAAPRGRARPGGQEEG